MLRVSGNNVLVVPPFECAWLSSDEHQLRDGRGCIFFQVKGENDITIIIKRFVGSKRWQHMQRAEDGGHHAPPQVDPNYTIILGSHGNRCLKIERNGILCCMVHDVIGAHVTGDVFSSYWLDYDNGAITIGAGTPSTPSGMHRWVDPHPLDSLRFVGLSSWDKHVAYRNINVGPCLADARRWGAVAPSVDDERARDHVPALATLAADALVTHLAPDSVVPLLVIADLPLANAPQLREAALAFLAANAESVLRAVPHHLPRLSVVHVEQMLCHAELTCSEVVVFEFMLTWSGAAWASSPHGDGAHYHSLAELERVLPRIRFPLMLPEELNNIAGHPLATTSPVLQQLLAEARADERGCAVQQPPRCPYEVCNRRLIRAAPSECALAAARFQRRASPKWRELLFINDGDANGLCAYLGTNCCTQTWVNPMLAGRISVRASSPSCRHTDWKAIVGRQPLHTNYAGPRLENGALCAWWAFDLGPNHRLLCNHYSLRHDASAAFPRDWALQGSEDGQAWVDLRIHAGDKALSMPQQYASWSVQGPEATKPMRWLRVVLRGACADGSWQLHLSNMELYGYLLTVP